MALSRTIRRYDLPIELFDDLIRAFEQDQDTTRYETWDQVVDYCRLSANPVGRLVLLMLESNVSDDMLRASDAGLTSSRMANTNRRSPLITSRVSSLWFMLSSSPYSPFAPWRARAVT